jgi:hypothetical protein
MALKDYLLEIRKQAREGLSQGIKCVVCVDKDMNVIATGDKDILATLELDIYSPYSAVNVWPNVKGKEKVDMWGGIGLAPVASCLFLNRVRKNNVNVKTNAAYIFSG